MKKSDYSFLNSSNIFLTAVWVFGPFSACNLEATRLIKYSNNTDLIVYDTYENCLNDVNVKLIVHPELDHDWPFMENYSVSASNEIWDFVSKYNLYGLIK